MKDGTILDPQRNQAMTGDILIEDQSIARVETEIVIRPGDVVVSARDMYVAPGFVDLQVNPGGGFCEAARFLAHSGITTPLFMACNSYHGSPLIDGYGGVLNAVKACSGLAVNAALAIPVEPPDSEGHETYVKLRCPLEKAGGRVAELKELGVTAIGEVVLPLNGIAHVKSDLAQETLDVLLDACETESMPLLVHTGLGLAGITGAIRVAGNRRMHLCHIGSTCAQDSIIAAVDALSKAPNITSDTHMSEFAGTTSRNSHIMLDAFRRGEVYKVDKETFAVKAVTDLAAAAPPFYYSKPNLFENNLVCAMSDNVAAIESDDLGDGIRAALMLKNVLAAGKMVTIPELKYNLLLKLVRKMTLNPARILGIGKGTLAIGADADVVAINKQTGRVEYTIVMGTIIVADGKYTGARPGRFVRRSPNAMP